MKRLLGTCLFALALLAGCADSSSSSVADEPTQSQSPTPSESPSPEPTEAEPMTIAILSETAAGGDVDENAVRLDVEESRQVLDQQLEHLEPFAQWIAAWIASRAIDQPAALTDRAFVESLDLETMVFDPPALAERYRALADTKGRYEWPFDPHLYEAFRTPMRPAAKRALRRSA